jgi:hypothetical protein
MATQKFTATIEKSGSGVVIAVPFDPNEVWGLKEKHYITGAVGIATVRGLLREVGGQFYIPLGPAWLRESRLSAGALVPVTLSPEGPQMESLSDDIASALAGEPQARAFFESLATFYRRNFIRWVEGAKRPETRASRIAEMVRLLKAGERQR